jgi:hypothetical protein
MQVRRLETATETFVRANRIQVDERLTFSLRNDDELPVRIRSRGKIDPASPANSNASAKLFECIRRKA